EDDANRVASNGPVRAGSEDRVPATMAGVSVEGHCVPGSSPISVLEAVSSTSSSMAVRSRSVSPEAVTTEADEKSRYPSCWRPYRLAARDRIRTTVNRQGFRPENGLCPAGSGKRAAAGSDMVM